MGIPLGPRGHSALTVLLDALAKAQDLKCSAWDFAVELSSLRRLQVTRSDVRWLVAKGFAQSAIEITRPGDPRRRFRQSPRPVFSRRCRLVLTPEGAQFAGGLCPQTDAVGASSHENGAPRIESSGRPSARFSVVDLKSAALPRWDRDRLTLTWDGALIRQFKVPRRDQETILAAFEAEAWPPRIDDPLPHVDAQPTKRRLADARKALNSRQSEGLLRVHFDEASSGIRWEAVTHSRLALARDRGADSGQLAEPKSS